MAVNFEERKVQDKVNLQIKLEARVYEPSPAQQLQRQFAWDKANLIAALSVVQRAGNHWELATQRAREALELLLLACEARYEIEKQHIPLKKR